MNTKNEGVRVGPLELKPTSLVLRSGVWSVLVSVGWRLQTNEPFRQTNNKLLQVFPLWPDDV